MVRLRGQVDRAVGRDAAIVREWVDVEIVYRRAIGLGEWCDTAETDCEAREFRRRLAFNNTPGGMAAVRADLGDVDGTD